MIGALGEVRRGSLTGDFHLWTGGSLTLGDFLRASEALGP